ncbi:MAG: hypothetical protein JNL87_04500 [Burkholderiaceae bacterium]|nr:hypothetical protein [Burkholderiaceae bacterium]
MRAAATRGRWRRAVAAAGAVLLLSAGLPGAGRAQDGSQDQQRQRLAAEIAAVEARFAEQRSACQSNFLVNDCVAAAQAARRQSLEGLRQRQLQLDDARRRERAAQRLREQQDRVQAQASAPRLQPPRRPAVAASAPSAPSAPSVPSAPASTGLPSSKRPLRQPLGPNASGPGAAAREQQQLEAYRQRQQAAEAHRQAVQDRNAARDAQKPPAAGLPVPGASGPAP